MRKLFALIAVACVTGCQFGCEPKFPKDFGKTVTLYLYASDKTLGPVQVAFIVGSAAPSGGPSALHALAADRIIPAVVADDDPNGPLLPFLLVPLPPHLADKFAVR